MSAEAADGGPSRRGQAKGLLRETETRLKTIRDWELKRRSLCSFFLNEETEKS